MSNPQSILSPIAWLVLSLGLASPAVSGDWPQILGPRRDGIAVDERALSAWPAPGPAVAWQHPLGEGFAGPAVAQERVIIYHRVGNAERCEALQAHTGERLWSVDFEATYRGGVNPDRGPRCVPLIEGDRVFLFGAAGTLRCLRAADGATVWSRDLYQDYDGDDGYFGAGATPLLVEDRLLVNVGGRGAGLVALNAETGMTLWKATDEGASYSSPTAATIEGQRQAIFVTRLNTVAVDPADGTVLYRFAFGKRGPTVNAATPLVFDEQLFVSSSYGVGARLSKLTARTAELVWRDPDVMASQYTTCVYHQGHLYGAHGREDFQNGELRCLDVKTGRPTWSAPQVGVAHTLLVNDRLLVLNNDGRLWLAEADPSAFRVVAEAAVSSDTVRALPALANGKFYFRDNAARGGKLIALQLTTVD